MKSTLLFGIGATAATAPSPDGRSYLTWLADTFIDTGVEPDFGYQDAVLYLGFEKAYELSGDEKYFEWYKGQVDDHVVLEDGSINDWNYTRRVLDEYRMGNNFLYLYQQTEDKKYKDAAEIIRHMLDVYPRSPSGGFWYSSHHSIHFEPVWQLILKDRHQEFFPNQMWLDGLYMAETFYAKWTYHFDKSNSTAWDDILLQYELIESNAHYGDSGLLVHGWADGDAPWADPETGKAPHVWGRAVGWYFMSLVEVLQYFPRCHRGYGKLRRYYTALAHALKQSRDPDSGSWWQVMEEPYRGEEGNFIEASGSAMFTWAMFKGVEQGLLGEREFLETAKESYVSLVENFISVGDDGALSFDGTVDECNLADGNVDFEYYITRPIVANHQNGCGPFMLASYEWETWAKDA